MNPLIEEKAKEFARKNGIAEENIPDFLKGVEFVLQLKAPSNELEKRRNQFREEVESHIEYPPGIRKEFFDYWTEENRPKTKMRWELQLTWNTKKRMARWASNAAGPVQKGRSLKEI